MTLEKMLARLLIGQNGRFLKKPIAFHIHKKVSTEELIFGVMRKEKK